MALTNSAEALLNTQIGRILSARIGTLNNDAPGEFLIKFVSDFKEGTTVNVGSGEIVTLTLPLGKSWTKVLVTMPTSAFSTLPSDISLAFGNGYDGQTQSLVGTGIGPKLVVNTDYTKSQLLTGYAGGYGGGGAPYYDPDGNQLTNIGDYIYKPYSELTSSVGNWTVGQAYRNGVDRASVVFGNNFYAFLQAIYLDGSQNLVFKFRTTSATNTTLTSTVPIYIMPLI